MNGINPGTLLLLTSTLLAEDAISGKLITVMQMIFKILRYINYTDFGIIKISL